MESHNLIITFYILDFSPSVQYDHVVIYENESCKLPYAIKASQLKIFYYSSNSFSTQIKFKFINIETKKESTEYQIEAFINHDNSIHIFLNSSYEYNIELYTQISPKEAFSHFLDCFPIQIEINKNKYQINVQFIDIFRNKGVTNLINFPLHFSFANPPVKYMLDKKDLGSFNYFKICLYMLYTNSTLNQNQRHYYITCHASHQVNTTQYEILKSLPDKKRDYINFMNSIVESIRQKIELYQGKDSPQIKLQLLNDIKEIYLSFTSHKELFCLAIIPIDKIPQLDYDYTTLFHSIYFCTLVLKKIIMEFTELNNSKNIYMDVLFVDRLYSYFIECYQIYQNKCKYLMSHRDNLNHTLKNFSMSYEVFEDQIDIHTISKIQEPIEVNLSELNENNFYAKGFNLFKDMVNNLKEDSFLIEPLIQLNSRISKDINLLNIKKENVFEISILDYRTIKSEIQDFIPNYVYRFSSHQRTRAFFNVPACSVAINEKYLFQEHYFEINEIFNGTNEKETYSIPIFTELVHELLGHRKIKANDIFANTPIKYVFNGEIKSASDAGRIIEGYISNDPNNIAFLKTPSDIIDFSQFRKSNLFNLIDLFTDNSNKALCEKISMLRGDNSKSLNKKDYTDKDIHYCIRTTIFNKGAIKIACS